MSYPRNALTRRDDKANTESEEMTEKTTAQAAAESAKTATAAVSAETAETTAADARRRHSRVTVALLALVLFMGGASFASVPLYRLFCQVTGYGGTPTSKNAAETVAVSVAETAAGEIVPVTVRFNADVARDLNWTFAPTERSVRITPGEVKKTLYSAHNNGARDVVGQATFNVTPAKVGKYFHKVHCFCFEEQPLRAGADALLDVQYFVDPEMLRDPTTSEVRTITLSYTFHYLEDMPPSAADVADAAAHDHSDHDHTLVKTE